MSTTHLSRSTFSRTMVAAALVLGPATAARSAERVTPALLAPTGGGATCNVLNVSAMPRQMSVEMRDSNGNFVSSASCSFSNPATFILPAGDLGSLFCVGTGFRYCRFKVKGGRNTIRGLLVVNDASLNPTFVLSAD